MADLRKFWSLARNWEALGDTDPMFGVLSDPTKYGGRWDPDEFFATGRVHIDKLLRMLADARATFEPGTCLDFGCGVGRLTVPLAAVCRRTVGVDVARPMVEMARRRVPAGARCEFVVNRSPDLRQFASGTFDLVHSCLVLQHIPPEVSLRYVAEFFRVAKPGGLVVFQVPAVTRSEADISAVHALPDTGYRAGIVLVDPPRSCDTSALVDLRLQVTNRSDVTWRHDIRAGRHICVGNHWLRADGSRVVDDDGRAFLPRPVAPADTVEIVLRVQAPGEPGRYQLEVDLVQEHVCWFAQRGSATARVAIDVAQAASLPAADPPVPEPASVLIAPGDPIVPATRPALRGSVVGRLLRRLRRGEPTFEMHVVPRSDVERMIRDGGGQLLRAVDDDAAGPGWLSYTYICRRL